MNDISEGVEDDNEEEPVVSVKLPSGTEIKDSSGIIRSIVSFLKRLLLAMFAIVLAVAASEFTVRRLYPEYGVPVFSTKLLTEFDPLLGWRKIPGFRGAHIQEEYTIVEQFNSRGLRGPEYPYEKPVGEYRILALGDSFTEGYTVEFEDLFSEMLKKHLNAELKTRIEVINAGTGGYSTDQELLFFQTEGKKYNPDLVIVLYCDNDAAMNIQPYYRTWSRGQKPLFELIDGKLSLKSTPQKTWDREEEAAKDLAKNEHEYKRKFKVLDLNTWYIYRLYRHAKSRGTENVIDAVTADETLENTFEDKDVAKDGYQGGQQEWVMTEALMGELKKEAESVGARFLLYNIPGKQDVYPGTRKERPIEHNLRVLSSRRDINFIQTVDVFRKQAAALDGAGKRLYWKKDSHWTPEGHHLTGLILAKHILLHREEYGLE